MTPVSPRSPPRPTPEQRRMPAPRYRPDEGSTGLTARPYITHRHHWRRKFRIRVLCHEHRPSIRRCATVREMKEGPSRSAIMG